MSSPSVAHTQAAETASALHSVGIDVDFAPVVDTPSSAHNFLGSRAFSRSRTWNAKLARAFVTGLQTSGVAGTAKHFPGLGLASGNTDHGRIVIGSAAWKLRQDLLPFKSAVAAGARLVMVSTAIYPKLDASQKPAAFSSTIINGLLRKQLGFKGVTVTDSLTAPAADRIPAHRDAGDARGLGPAHLRRGERKRARLRHIARGRPKLAAPRGAAHAGGSADPRPEGLARRARRPDVRFDPVARSRRHRWPDAGSSAHGNRARCGRTLAPERPRTGSETTRWYARSGASRCRSAAKLLVGFAVVAALLALVAALGLLALNQSNSRGEQLRSLQQTSAFARIVEADAYQLNDLVGQRSGNAGGGLTGLGPAVYAAMDSDVLVSLARFEADVDLPAIAGGLAGHVRSFDPHFVPRLKATLTAFQTAWGTVITSDAKGGNSPGLIPNLQKAGQLAGQAASEANTLDSETSARADALVAANHSGFVSSRNLLIGVGAGSLALALALGLLLSWSVVAPLKRTQERLAEIARGDFAGHVDVPTATRSEPSPQTSTG